MLTMLAEENIEYAAVIVKVVEDHIAKVPSEIKLPILYLIDSIVKNVKSTYVQLFSQCIVNIFCGAFEKVNEKIRERMYALRQTWNEVFSAQRLYALDVKVKRLDHNWPITAKQPSIHVNPNFLKANNAQAIPTEMEKILQDKTRELLELKKRKLELELEATKKHLEEQEKQFSKTAEGVIAPVEALVAANSLQTVGIRGAAMPTQMMPGLMAPGYMGGPSIAVNPAMRPAMFHANIRGFRPNLHPNMMNNTAQGMQGGNMMPAAMNAANLNKPKVHPVNSALLNSVRQRDPRLQRQQQQQQQQQQQMQQQQMQQNNERSLAAQQQNVRSSHLDKDKHERNHKSSHKSPTRINSSSRSSGSSSSRSSKSSQRDKERERDRERKRSESKSSTTSSSSSGSNATNNERKKGFSKTDKTTSKCDKDAFEIAPLATAFKRKSTSPTSSPTKSRDSKRSSSHKTRNLSRSKTRSRSRSPDDKPTTHEQHLVMLILDVILLHQHHLL
ncbi:pre-mRNA cleavage complex 2 protein Pcf11-like [Lucilia sericata]|uniref:pre-mRNA cleavage complex 2 protein Pcf11-like n=1 Tax=Lucilia sericata TaxID=13632 RepID=UPI0018A88306|nr:pre-mRNA cleavage complex 2 protein Pcf11-like [Lucilia sericata]